MVRCVRRFLGTSLLALLFFALPVDADIGMVEGPFSAGSEPVALAYATVHQVKHPFDEGHTVYLFTLSEQEIPYLEVDDTCPGEYGNRSLQLKIDKEREVLMTNYCFASGSSSGHTFELDFDAFGPSEFVGSAAAEFEVFDDAVSFALSFHTTLPSELPGEALPAGGGEAGAAYLAWSAAVASGDFARITALLPAEQAEMFASMPEAEQKENIEFIQMMAPSELEILGGRRVDDLAYLEVRAVMEGEPVSGEIKLMLTDGTWVAVKESW